MIKIIILVVVVVIRRHYYVSTTGFLTLFASWLYKNTEAEVST
jgi:hypothetical protein